MKDCYNSSYSDTQVEELNTFSQFREEAGTWEWKPGFQTPLYPQEYADIPLRKERKHVKMQSTAKPPSLLYKSTSQWLLLDSLGKEPANIHHFKGETY